MHALTAAAALALAAIPAVSAHGFVSGVVSGGKWYAGADPVWFYSAEKPKRAGWYAKDQDLGFVSPAAFGSADIICHIDAEPATDYIPVQAGSSIDLQWSPWPESHHGPVLTYLARCKGGDCTKVDKTTLNFFKIAEGGLVDGSAPPGTWVSDELIAANNTATVKIPAGIQGNFVLRHEIIALHSAGDQNGAQNYPMCLNVKITGSGNERPCKSGADCRLGTKLYKANDPGILVSIYSALSKYVIPGPKLYKGAAAKVRRHARAFGF